MTCYSAFVTTRILVLTLCLFWAALSLLGCGEQCGRSPESTPRSVITPEEREANFQHWLKEWMGDRTTEDALREIREHLEEERKHEESGVGK